jgi:D-tyrosyl-tRNA(Tyr) deacylase
MRAVVQRILKAEITIDNTEKRSIGQGFLILLGVHGDDTETEAKLLADKIANLRIFCDEDDKMNLSLLDVDGDALVVSNFTLYADCVHGRRPSFFESAKPDIAEPLYKKFVDFLADAGVKEIKTGEFGADMDIDFVNHGPVTIILDTDVLKKGRK